MTKKARAKGLTIHRCKRIRYLSIFGVIEIPSPYLWDKNEGKGARPVKEQLGIEHGDLSRVVQRAMTDFGAEESFGQAAKRFEEHYGWAIDRACVRREVEKTALKAQKYLDMGLPIGSGEVESAHRYIPQKRLKIPGSTWHPDTVNPMLALRIIRANGWWEDFWTRASYCQKINI